MPATDTRKDPSLWSLFLAAASIAPDQDCVVWGERRSSYGEIRRRAFGLARHLKLLGLGRHTPHGQLAAHQSGQDHVAIYMHNRPEYVESVLGILAARAVPLNVNYRYVEDELCQILAAGNVRAVIYEARFSDRVVAIRSRLTGIRHWIEVSDGEPRLEGSADYDSIAEAEGDEFSDDTSSDDLSIVYTGGTTGQPKAVLWRQAELIWSLTGGVNSITGKPISSLNDLTQTVGRFAYKVLVLPPMMHLAGMSMVLIGLPAGATILMPETTGSLKPAEVWQMVERERPTTVLVVGNAMGKPLLDELEARPYDLSSLRGLVNGAAAMSASVRKGLLSHLPKSAYVFDSLGSSESGKQMQVVHRAGGAASESGLKPLPTTVVISEDRTRLLAPGDEEIGWLGSSGRLPRGYLNDPAKTAATFPVIDGRKYAVPGDRARYNSSGVIEILGRDAAIINTGGEKVFAEEVEAILLSHGAVHDAIVVGRPSERWGSEVVAVLSFKHAGTTVDEVLKHCDGRLARYKMPKDVIVVDEVYRAPNGKADYAWARRVASGGG